MKIEDFEKSKKELEKIKEQNNEQILINDERTRMANVNQLEFKGLTALFFSLFGYFGLFITTAILINLLGVSVIANVLPVLGYPGVLLGGSLIIGTIAGTLFNKKFKAKDRLKAFSTAKTQSEKLEEEIHYQIELEKVNNRNKAIDNSIKLLDSNQSILDKVSSRYDLNDRNAPKSEDEAKLKLEELSTISNEQYDKLDLLTTQKVLMKLKDKLAV